MLVDDEPLILASIKRQLRKRFDVDTATSGQEGLDKVRDHGPYAVVVSDMQMPQMDGVQFLSAVQELAPNSVRIMLTGNADQRTAVDAINRGSIFRFHTKPCPLEDLAKSIAAGIEQHRLMLVREQLEETNVQLVQAREEAERAANVKGEFLANMSHEIRTPLTAILGYSELAYQSTIDRPDVQKDLGVILTNGKHLLELINDILDLSKIDSDKFQVETIGCSLVDIIADVYAIMRLRAQDKNIDLIATFDGPMVRTIRSDPTRLRQVLINLVGNAIKFTESGGVTVRARLINLSDQPTVDIRVIDTGIGIKQSRLEAIFDPFTQADITTTRQYGGTGLGLTVTKRILAALSGSVSVESVEGKGTTFTVTIPANSPDPSDKILDPNADLNNIHQCNPDHAWQDEAWFNGKVLIADDTPVNRSLVRRMLTAIGVEVDEAENGKQAYEAATRGEYDLILMDLHMPVMDGTASLKRIREHDQGLPVIALTADAMQGARERCRAAGFSGYLTKPLVRNDIIQELAKYLKQAPKPGRESGPGDPGAGEGSMVLSEKGAPTRGRQDTGALNPGTAMGRLQVTEDVYREALEETFPWIIGQFNTLGEMIDDIDQVVQSAHAIKSGSGSVGLDRVHTVAGELESIARGNREGDVQATLTQLGEAVEEAKLCVERYLVGSSASHTTDRTQQA